MDTFELSERLYETEKNTTKYDTEVEPRIEIVKKWIGTGKKLLDLGCYDGRYSEIFKKLGNEVYGLDASPTAVREAQKRGICASVGNLESIFPFESGFFDVIHAGEVIEHLYDTDKFMEECRRVLCSGGELIISTPNTLSLPRRLVYLFGIGRFFEASNTYATEEKSVGHIRFFTKELLAGFVQSKGFRRLNYESDYVNLPFFRSKALAWIRPTFGRTLIMKFKKNRGKKVYKKLDY